MTAAQPHPHWHPPPHPQVLDKDPGKEADKRIVEAALKEMATWEHSADTTPGLASGPGPTAPGAAKK